MLNLLQVVSTADSRQQAAHPSCESIISEQPEEQPLPSSEQEIATCKWVGLHY